MLYSGPIEPLHNTYVSTLVLWKLLAQKKLLLWWKIKQNKIIAFPKLNLIGKQQRHQCLFRTKKLKSFSWRMKFISVVMSKPKALVKTSVYIFPLKHIGYSICLFVQNKKVTNTRKTNIISARKHPHIKRNYFDVIPRELFFPVCNSVLYLVFPLVTRGKSLPLWSFFL